MRTSSYFLYWGLSKSEYTYLDFIRELITALAQEEIDKRRNGFYSRDKVSGYKSKNDWENDYSKVVGCHTPSVIKETVEEIHNKEDGTMSKRNYHRGNCMICKAKVPTRCRQRNVTLCLNDDETEVNCWERFHFCKKYTDPL